jgi:hypothetical protein
VLAAGRRDVRGRCHTGCLQLSVIVHAVNPPGYRNWGKLVLSMLDNTIAVAQANGARIVLPGTVYNFGPDVLPGLHEDSPQTPVTAKGKFAVRWRDAFVSRHRGDARS